MEILFSRDSGAAEPPPAPWFKSEAILDQLPHGIAVVDADLKLRWANRCLKDWGRGGSWEGLSFFDSLNQPELIGPDYSPFQRAVVTGQAAWSNVHTADNRYFHLHVCPLNGSAAAAGLVVTLNDVTAEVQQQQRLAAIHQAGTRLADLKPDEIFAMDVEERIELLKDNIQHYTQDLLHVDVIEVRLLEQSTGDLIPLLSVGIDQEAADRHLMARPQGNGVTGYVAASGRSYLCEDTSQDPLYIEGFKGARSSLTVPILLHEEVIGTINVESPQVGAFLISDIQFLEIFARDVAMALNTLELLVAQKTNAAQQSCEAIHAAVALPIDDILLDSVHVMEKYIGHDPVVVQRLQRILRNARDIKRSIHQIGQNLAPIDAAGVGGREGGSRLRSKRILVVDADEQVRNDAHALLERYGCIVEAAQNGDEAVMMVRGCGEADAYDVIISDIRLPDYSGYQLMLRLQELMSPVPMVLMTGFGYDPGHSIVKARQAGLHPKAILYKPFRLDQLLSVTETVIEHYQTTASGA